MPPDRCGTPAPEGPLDEVLKPHLARMGRRAPAPIEPRSKPSPEPPEGQGARPGRERDPVGGGATHRVEDPSGESGAGCQGGKLGKLTEQGAPAQGLLPAERTTRQMCLDPGGLGH